MKAWDRQSRYYEDMIRLIGEELMLVHQNNTMLNEVHAVLKENNLMLKKLIDIQVKDHKTNLDISDNIRKIKFNTQ